MRSLVFSDRLLLEESDIPVPPPGEALIKVSASGICNTDIEITRGYVPGFSGIPGHEFIGSVESVPSPRYEHLLGRRVTAEINCGCGHCPFCEAKLARHCPDRTVIGIIKRNGSLAEYISVPVENIIEIPDSISDENALFIEPLAAALEILEQYPIRPEHRVLIIGDGKLAHLIALTLKSTGCDLIVSGKHRWKTDLLNQRNITAVTNRSDITAEMFDIVIEASGSPQAFNQGLAQVKPRGIFFLKSTYARDFSFNPAGVVVNEITLIGSRCGQFAHAIEYLEREQPDLSYLISRRFPLSDGIAAFSAALQPDVMKVILDC